jgi:hypothetical protein
MARAVPSTLQTMRLILTAVTLFAVAPAVCAQDYPRKAVHVEEAVSRLDVAAVHEPAFWHYLNFR